MPTKRVQTVIMQSVNEKAATERESRRTKVVKVKNEILKEPNQKEGTNESRGQEFILGATFVSLVHLWDVISSL